MKVKEAHSTDEPIHGFEVNVKAMPFDMSDESDFDISDDDEEKHQHFWSLKEN